MQLKTTLMTLALAAAALSATAQEKIFKPTTGANNLEVQVNPFVSNPFQLSGNSLISGIKYRRFTSPTAALRLTANLNYSRTSTITQDAGTGGSTQKELRDRRSSFGLVVRPGIEKHFAGTDRLSPYIGAEVALGFTTTRLVEESEEENNTVVETVVRNRNGFLLAGANALAGVDIYLIPNLYIGTEFGFGLAYTSPFATKVKPPQGSEFETREEKEATFSVGPYVQSAVRIGYIF